MEKIKLNKIRIIDTLFGSYVKQVPDKILKYQWNVLNDKQEEAFPTYCIENFRIAAGELEGERKGVVFQDTDLYKWLEAVAFCIANGSGAEYEAIADNVIDLIGRAQEADGYLNTYFTINAPEKKWTNLVEGHELYTAGHLMEAAVAYYEATGKDALLQIAQKNADLICGVFGRGENQIKGYPGHEEVEIGLIKLYYVTGEKKYLDTAYYFIDERGKEPNYFTQEIARRGKNEFFPEFSGFTPPYLQADMQPKYQATAEGHAVRVMYMCAAMADLAKELHDDELAEACQRLWDNVTKKRMYITGGIGSSGFLERFTTDYDLPNRTGYSETCASIGLMMFGQRMTELTGEAQYYDIVERALYNVVLAGINIEGNRYFYVNPLEMIPAFCTEHTYMDHVKPIRQKWFKVACCPTNVARTLASLGNYIYAKDEKGLYIHQFISSELEEEFGNGILQLKMQSGLLNDGMITLNMNYNNPQVVAENNEDIIVRVRIPEYAEQMTITSYNYNMKKEKTKGYLVLNLRANIEYKVSISFGVKPRWIAAHNKVSEDLGKVALLNGPCVYCIEEVDNGPDLGMLYVKTDTEPGKGRPADGLVGNVPTLNYKTDRIVNLGIGESDLYGKPSYKCEEKTVTAIPYCMWNNRGMGEMQIWHKVKF